MRGFGLFFFVNGWVTDLLIVLYGDWFSGNRQKIELT